MAIVRIPTSRIIDWDSLHRVFAEIMGFPDFYGRNMNAWIDCMTSLDAPEDGMTHIHCSPHDVVVLHLADVDGFKSRCRELYDAVIECSAFVNFRKLERGEPAVLAIAFWKDES